MEEGVLAHPTLELAVLGLAAAELQLEDRNGKRVATYQLKPGGGKSEYSKFKGGTCEDALLHILKFRQVSNKLAHRHDYNAAMAKQAAADKRLEKSDLAHIADNNRGAALAAAAAANPEDSAAYELDDVSKLSGKMDEDACKVVIEEI